MKDVTLRVSNRELDALEDLCTIWFLCPRHKALNVNTRTEEDVAVWESTCKYCSTLRRAAQRDSLRLWTKLVRAYDRPRPVMKARRS